MDMNNVYDVARYRLMTSAFDWRAANLVLTAWSGTPVFSATDETIADVATHGPVERGSSLPITSKTVASNGTAQTNQVVIPDVLIGDPVTFFTMSDGDELVLFIDEATELPFVPNGLDMLVQSDWLEQRGWWRA
jgi:hypothetical protein